MQHKKLVIRLRLVSTGLAILLTIGKATAFDDGV
jgi:hypothetical protein